MFGEGVFAGFFVDYLTESPSGDETTLPSHVGVARIGSFLPRWRVFLYVEGAFARVSPSFPAKAPSRNYVLKRQNHPPVTKSPSGEGVFV